MIFTGKKIRKILSDPYSLAKFEWLKNLSKAIDEKVTTRRRGCQKCKISNGIKEAIYNKLTTDAPILAYFKEFYSVDEFHIFFKPVNQEKEKLFKISQVA